MLPTWMYVKSADSIYVNIFIGSTLTVEDVAGTDVEIVQATDYPWSGNVSITVNPAVEKSFSVRVRVPNRSVSDLYTSTPESDGISSISVNRSVITPPIEKGYAVITRKWKAGDDLPPNYIPVVIRELSTLCVLFGVGEGPDEAGAEAKQDAAKAAGVI